MFVIDGRRHEAGRSKRRYQFSAGRPRTTKENSGREGTGDDQFEHGLGRTLSTALAGRKETDQDGMAYCVWGDRVSWIAEGLEIVERGVLEVFGPFCRVWMRRGTAGCCPRLGNVADTSKIGRG